MKDDDLQTLIGRMRQLEEIQAKLDAIDSQSLALLADELVLSIKNLQERVQHLVCVDTDSEEYSNAESEAKQSLLEAYVIVFKMADEAEIDTAELARSYLTKLP